MPYQRIATALRLQNGTCWRQHDVRFSVRKAIPRVVLRLESESEPMHVGKSDEIFGKPPRKPEVLAKWPIGGESAMGQTGPLTPLHGHERANANADVVRFSYFNPPFSSSVTVNANCSIIVFLPRARVIGGRLQRKQPHKHHPRRNVRVHAAEPGGREGLRRCRS